MWHPRSQTKIPFRNWRERGKEFWTWQDLLAELMINARTLIKIATDLRRVTGIDHGFRRGLAQQPELAGVSGARLSRCGLDG